MGVMVRYRFDVTKPFKVTSGYQHLFGKLEVTPGIYHYTFDTRQIDHEREINETVRRNPGCLSAKIERTFVEGL